AASTGQQMFAEPFSGSGRPWRALQFDDVALWILHVQRRPLPFGAIARSCLSDLHASGSQVRANFRLIITVDGDAEVVEIASFLAWSGAAHPAQLAVNGYQIDQGAAGPDLGQSDFGLHALDPAAQDLAIEAHHAVEIAHAQDDMIQPLDLEGN